MNMSEKYQQNQLVNAFEMSLKYPNFFVPKKEDLDKLNRGDFVKVCYDNERFWCRIINVIELKNNIDYMKRYFICVIDNVLGGDRESFNFEDELLVTYCNIYEIGTF